MTSSRGQPLGVIALSSVFSCGVGMGLFGSGRGRGRGVDERRTR